jgi:hypothetical protein
MDGDCTVSLVYWSQNQYGSVHEPTSSTPGPCEQTDVCVPSMEGSPCRRKRKEEDTRRKNER